MLLMRNWLFIMTLVTQQQNGQLIIGTSSPVCRFAVTIHQEVTGENFGAKLLEPKSVCNLFPDFFLKNSLNFCTVSYARAATSSLQVSSIYGMVTESFNVSIQFNSKETSSPITSLGKPF